MRSLLAAAAISLTFTLLLTPLFIRLFKKLQWGQVIRTPEDPHNPSHQTKRGTPTMGGIVFILATITGYLVGTLTGGSPPTVSGLLVIWMMVGLAVIGFIDDYMKVRHQNTLGLSGWRKVLGQVAVAVPFGVMALTFPNALGQTPGSAYISLFRDIPMLWFMVFGGVIGWILYLAWISFLSVAWSNATNLTDGLDGLATGAGIFTMGAYSLVTFWQVQQRCTSGALLAAYQSACYDVRDPMDLTIIAASFVGALVGFLWWNAPKAKIFMGDTGSMAIGGVIVALSVLSRTEILAVIIAGFFIVAPGSVVLQRYYFKATGGKRLFLMSPFHHHLEMRGWPEVTIVVRLWIVSGILAVTGVGLFYVAWLAAI